VLGRAHVLAARGVLVGLGSVGLANAQEHRLGKRGRVDGTDIDLGVARTLARGSVVVLGSAI
jgi:UDP-N-acetyl-D-mannosaminuronate dehydrogenase